jgi:hypothetical protein
MAAYDEGHVQDSDHQGEKDVTHLAGFPSCNQVHQGGQSLWCKHMLLATIADS